MYEILATIIFHICKKIKCAVNIIYIKEMIAFVKVKSENIVLFCFIAEKLMPMLNYCFIYTDKIKNLIIFQIHLIIDVSI